ncbi:MAG: protein-export chaperone SecB [Clostridia bacterium]|nr:protein-export chaperone SecB [Clostridia bacterium]
MAYLKFQGYSVPELNFKQNVHENDVKNFKINPNLKFDISKRGENFLLAITVTVQEKQEELTPFDTTVKIVGKFSVETEGSIDAMRIEASEVLFPYARATLTQLTTTANMPPYILPTINFRQPIVQPKAQEKPEIKITPIDDNI